MRITSDLSIGLRFRISNNKRIDVEKFTKLGWVLEHNEDPFTQLVKVYRCDNGNYVRFSIISGILYLTKSEYTWRTMINIEGLTMGEDEIVWSVCSLDIETLVQALEYIQFLGVGE